RGGRSGGDNPPGLSSTLASAFSESLYRVVHSVRTTGSIQRGRRRDGSTFWMEVSFSRVPVGGRVLTTGIFRDITLRKETEERIRRLNEDLDARVRLRTAQLEDARSKLEMALTEAHDASASKDRFIGIVSHELRTPL